MSGEIIYRGGQDGTGHVCDPPTPSYEPKGAVWLCECGQVRVKTEYTHIPETWRHPYPWEFHLLLIRRRGLKKMRERRAAEQFKQDEEVVRSFSEAQARRDERQVGGAS